MFNPRIVRRDRIWRAGEGRRGGRAVPEGYRNPGEDSRPRPPAPFAVCWEKGQHVARTGAIPSFPSIPLSPYKVSRISFKTISCLTSPTMFGVAWWSMIPVYVVRECCGICMLQTSAWKIRSCGRTGMDALPTVPLARLLPSCLQMGRRATAKRQKSCT